METCPVCRKRLALRRRAGDKKIEIRCELCGNVLLSSTDDSNLIKAAQAADPRLAAWIRAQNFSGNDPAEIVDLKVLLDNLPLYKVMEKQIVLLRVIEKKTLRPGFEVKISNYNDYPLAWADNSEELYYHLVCLEQRNLITLVKSDKEEADLVVVITGDGWEKLDQYSSKPAFPDQVFVAMSFKKTFNKIWEKGIEPAINRAGYKALRVDKEPHLDRIDAKIISDIKDSLFVVADVTGQKQGVYFEAGFAIGLGRRVIWSVREDELKRVHFDTRQYNHIIWKTPVDLCDQLYYRICAVIGKGKAVKTGPEA